MQPQLLAVGFAHPLYVASRRPLRNAREQIAFAIFALAAQTPCQDERLPSVGALVLAFRLLMVWGPPFLLPVQS